MGREPDARPGDTTRVELFSDSVFAIAVTLLVLELATHQSRGSFDEAFVDQSSRGPRPFAGEHGVE